MNNKMIIISIIFINLSFLVANEKEIFDIDNNDDRINPYIFHINNWGENTNKNSLSLINKTANGTQNPQHYRVDIGFNNNFLISSEILKKGYSGFGFFLEPYITKYISFKIEYDYWIISSLENEPYDTPFNIMHVWKENYLLKINIFPWNHQIYTQIGSVRINREIGHEERSGLHLGVGCGIINKENINLFLVAKRNIFVRPFIGIGGSETWDIHNSEISIEITYSIKWNKN